MRENYGAFEECNALDLTSANNSTVLSAIENCNKIPARLFKNCLASSAQGLSISTILHDGLISIGEDAFNLNGIFRGSFLIPNSLTKIANKSIYSSTQNMFNSSIASTFGLTLDSNRLGLYTEKDATHDNS
jgi:hypothetical protein